MADPPPHQPAVEDGDEGPDDPRPPAPATAGGLGPRDATYDNVIELLEAGAGGRRTSGALREAIDRALFGAGRLAFGARLVRLGVRGTGGAEVGPAELAIDEEASTALGPDLQTHALVGGTELQIWLAGAVGLRPGSAVVLLALGGDGLLAARAEAPADAGAPLKLSLPWASGAELPALALVVELTVAGPGR